MIDDAALFGLFMGDSLDCRKYRYACNHAICNAMSLRYCNAQRWRTAAECSVQLLSKRMRLLFVTAPAVRHAGCIV